ncbi:hypothetical protein JCM11491_004891 [Sporobolomyces phaffii]
MATKRSVSPEATPETNNKQARTEEGRDASLNTAPAPAPEPEPEAVPAGSALPKREDVEDELPRVDKAGRLDWSSKRATGVPSYGMDTVSRMYADGNELKGWPADEQHEVLYPYSEELNLKVCTWTGDITHIEVDCIVNAANKSLMGGGGVDGAIHSAAGPGLGLECSKLKGAETGQTKLTSGHRLPARYIAHTVGPIYAHQRKAECERQLRQCYRGTLELCVQHGIKSVAFSGISTGVYGYPIDAAARVACDEVRKFLESDDGKKIDQVIFVSFRPVDVASYVDNLPSYFPPPPSDAKADAADSSTSGKDSSAEAKSGEAGTGEEASATGATPEPDVQQGKVPPGKASARKSGKQTHVAPKE